MLRQAWVSEEKNVPALLLHQQQPCAEVTFFFVVTNQQKTEFRFKLVESSYRNVQNA